MQNSAKPKILILIFPLKKDEFCSRIRPFDFISLSKTFFYP